MPKPKHASSYSLTPDAKAILSRLSESLGVPRSAILELAIRTYSVCQPGLTTAKKNRKKQK